MKSLYCIFPIPFCDKLPEKGTKEEVITSSFYLFQVWHESEYMIKLYMEFIDKWFDNAFTNLNLQIIEYQYPDYITYGSGEMVEWINAHHGMDDLNPALQDEQELSIVECNNAVLGNIDIMLNAYVYEDQYELGSGIFNDSVLYDQITVINHYIKSKEIHDILRLILWYIDDVSDYASALAYGAYEFYKEGTVDPYYVSLYQLITFVSLDE